MANHMLLLAFLVVPCFRGIHMTIVFADNPGRLSRFDDAIAKIVVGENIFQKLAVREETHACCRASWVCFTGKRVRFVVERFVVPSFVNANAPDNHAGMIPVTLNHGANITMAECLPIFIPDMLPAWDFIKD